MSESVFFSVLIPVYNVASWLRECLDSVLGQGYERLELMVIDDGSTDESAAICDEYAARDKRVRVFHKENGGLMSARRAAIARAKGEYYLFVDSDDCLLPGALATLAAAVGESGADCLLYGVTRELPGGIVHVTSPASLCGRVITDRHEMINLVLNDNTYNSLCRKCVRSSCFDGRDFSPYFSVSRGEDLLQTTEILENARSFYILPQELYYYRLNSTSITRSICFDGYQASFVLETFLLGWLKEQSFITGEDFDRWRNHLLDELVMELKRICRYCSDRENTVAAMESILSADFYRGFLAVGYRGGGGGLRRPPNRFVISLLRRRRYDALILFCTRIYRSK